MVATAIELVNESARIYANSSDWEHYYTRDSVIVGHSHSDDGSDIITFRGSQTAIDWMRNFNATPVWHNDIGFCHAGFLTDMDDVIKEITCDLKLVKNFSITGHSLGGARARIATGLFLTNSLLPVRRVLTFGSPKPAFINLARVIQKSTTLHESVRNRNDIVPEAPITVSPFNYVHTEDYIKGDCAPSSLSLEPLRDHSVSLYQQAVITLTNQGVLK